MNRFPATRATLVGAALAIGWTAPAAAADITLFRFFGDCANEYGDETDLSKANGECGIIQVLTNKFNAENTIGATVTTQTVDWGAYYDLLAATYSTNNIPDVAVMHGSVLPDFVARELVMPLDETFETAGIDADDFLPAARDGVTVGGQMYALPFDIHALLTHINVDLMAEAGLVDGAGEPVLPTSVDEMLEQGRQFREKTGKTYFAVESHSASVMNLRFFDSMVWQQGGDVITEDGEAMLEAPEAVAAAEVIKAMYDEGLADPNLDYAGAEQAFLNGEAGLLLNGTWGVDNYASQAEGGEAGLKTYRVADLPTLFDEPAVWSDNHEWTIPTNPDRSPEAMEAAAAFLAFLNDNNYEWARTGHLSVRQSVIDSPEFEELPHRSEFAGTAEIARSLPSIQNQRSIQDTMFGEINALWLTGAEPADALAAAQSRVSSTLRRSRR